MDNYGYLNEELRNKHKSNTTSKYLYTGILQFFIRITFSLIHIRLRSNLETKYSIHFSFSKDEEQN